MHRCSERLVCAFQLALVRARSATQISFLDFLDFLGSCNSRFPLFVRVVVLTSSTILRFLMHAATTEGLTARVT